MITIETQGGLGNQLFQAALALEIEERTGHSVYLDPWRHGIRGGRPFELPYRSLGLNIRQSSHRLMMQEGVLGRLSRRFRRILTPKLIIEKSPGFDSYMLNPADGTILQGYFQSWRYSRNSAAKMSSSLEALRKSSTWISDNQKKMSASGPWFGVHIRRGDYLGALGKGIFGTPTLEYYREAISQIQTCHPTARGVIFTDDFENALRDYPKLFSELEVFSPMDQGSSLDNMLLMGAGVGLVSANSSFSWWAARLSPNQRGVFTVPSNWFINADQTPDDLVPRGWILI
jgi:hypothetical protein